MDFTLFRIKVALPKQPDMFRAEPPSPPEIVRRAIVEKPTDYSGKRGLWHIGNPEPLGDSGLYFALGRTTRAARTLIDPKTDDFVEDEYENAPYTHLLLDIPLEVVAIARKTGLARNTHTLARKLERVLASSDVAKQHSATFRVDEIRDPEQFIEILRTAYAITSFTITFGRPNPIDTEEDFFKPMEKVVQEVDGREGSATFKGESLDEGPLIQLAASAAATGDDAKARVTFSAEEEPVTRKLKGETANFTHPELGTTEQRLSALEKLRQKYRSIRHSDG